MRVNSITLGRWFHWVRLNITRKLICISENTTYVQQFLAGSDCISLRCFIICFSSSLRYSANENYVTNKFRPHYKLQGSCFVRPMQFKMRNILLSCNQRSSDFNTPNSVAYMYCNNFPEHCIFSLLQLFAFFFSRSWQQSTWYFVFFCLFVFAQHNSSNKHTCVACGPWHISIFSFPAITYIIACMPIAATLAGTHPPPQWINLQRAGSQRSSLPAPLSPLRGNFLSRNRR